LLSNWLRAGRGEADIFLPLTTLAPHQQPSLTRELTGGSRGYALGYELQPGVLGTGPYDPEQGSLTIDWPEDAALLREDATPSRAAPFEGHSWNRSTFWRSGRQWVALWTTVPATLRGGGESRIVLWAPLAFEEELIGLAGSMRRYAAGSEPTTVSTK